MRLNSPCRSSRLGRMAFQCGLLTHITIAVLSGSICTWRGAVTMLFIKAHNCLQNHSTANVRWDADWPLQMPQAAFRSTRVRRQNGCNR